MSEECVRLLSQSFLKNLPRWKIKRWKAFKNVHVTRIFPSFNSCKSVVYLLCFNKTAKEISISSLLWNSPRAWKQAWKVSVNSVNWKFVLNKPLKNYTLGWNYHLSHYHGHHHALEIIAIFCNSIIFKHLCFFSFL